MIVLKNIEAVVFDFDGVFTDNRVLVDEDGKESVFCNRSDGLGVEMLKRQGIKICVISKEKNKVVLARCKKLQIECFYGIDDKVTVFQKWCDKESVDVCNVVFVGNDINDVACIKKAGYGIAVCDAYDSVKEVADFILEKKGGHGAVRELADIILNGKRDE